MFFLTVALLSAAPDCIAHEVTRAPAVLEEDFDGDGKPDRLTVKPYDKVTVEFTKLPPAEASLMLEVVRGFEVPLGELKVPAATKERIFGFVEANAFDLICTTPHPSWERLRAQEKAKRKKPALVWVPGPPTAPQNMFIREGDAWTMYRGDWHADLGSGSPWKKTVTLGPHKLLQTNHGLVLTDATESRHAWLYVADKGIYKLRQPSVTDAQFVSVNVVKARRIGVYFEAPREDWVEINLNTGVITERVINGR
ncbi:MAG: hypothetical protein QM817_28695 [Archangium sp.]